jgi:hypothetical protein
MKSLPLFFLISPNLNDSFAFGANRFMCATNSKKQTINQAWIKPSDPNFIKKKNQASRMKCSLLKFQYHPILLKLE